VRNRREARSKRIEETYTHEAKLEGGERKGRSGVRRQWERQRDFGTHLESF